MKKIKKSCAIISLLSIILSSHSVLAAPPANFSQAKKEALKIYKDHPTTFYCNCPIDWQNKKGVVDLEACGYKIRKNENRARRVEWEHVVPASKFVDFETDGEQRSCWKEGGRKNCSKNDDVFKLMEGDLHNIQPAIGEINGDRGNLPFFEWESTADSVYGSCPIKIDFKRDQVDPPDAVKGQIARIYLYMYEKYNLKYSVGELIQMDHWNKIYPVNAWECERDRKIAKIQGNHNQYVKDACDVANL